MRIGIGRERITPPAGIPFLGHSYRVSEGIHDDLWAKVMVFEGDGEEAAVVAMDLCWPMPEGDYVKIRDAIQEATGIKGEKVMVSCTHSHSGPEFTPRPEFNIPIKRQRELIEPWVEELPLRVAEAARKAVEGMRRGTIRFGRELMTGISYNRRKRTPYGVVSLICDTDDMPERVREQFIRWGMPREEAEERVPLGIPDGPIDPDLDVIWAEDDEGRAFAILVNFACHAVACGPPVPYLISAGFPGFTAKFVEEATGGICLYTAGAGGDIRPYRSRPRGFEEAQRIGLVLASGVLRAMREGQRIEGRLRVVSERVEIELREYPPRDEAERLLEQKRRLLEEASREGRFHEAKRLYDEIRQLDFALVFGGWIDQRGTVSLELQAISIGDIVLLGIPNEVNVSLGLELKRRAWTDKLVVLTLTNGCYMYLLKRKEYDEGGYEVAACRLAPGSGERVLEAALRLVERLKGSG
jgi:hypothetical protein